MCFQKRGIYRTKNARAHETSTILCLTCYVGHRPVPKTVAVKNVFLLGVGGDPCILKFGGVPGQ